MTDFERADKRAAVGAECPDEEVGAEQDRKPQAGTSRKWQWVLGLLGFIGGLEFGYQFDYNVSLPLAALAAMIGRTIDTRRLSHWIYLPAVFLLAFATVRATPAQRALRQGEDAMERREYQSAVAHFTDALEEYRDSAAAYLGRGVAHAQLGDHESAIRDFGSAISLTPSSSAYHNRALSYLRIGRFDDAIADARHAIEHDPQDAGAFMVRAAAYEATGDQEAAAADIEEALRLQGFSSQEPTGILRIRDDVAIGYGRGATESDAQALYDAALHSGCIEESDPFSATLRREPEHFTVSFLLESAANLDDPEVIDTFQSLGEVLASHAFEAPVRIELGANFGESKRTLQFDPDEK